MKQRDRVLAALNHDAPDRCPMQISLTPEFTNRRQRELKQSGRRVHNPQSAPTPDHE